MAAAWQASGTLLGSTGADISPVPPAHLTDDILILVAASRVTTETLLTPSNYNLVSSTSTTGWIVYAFWARATSAAMGNALCDWSAAVGEKYGQIHTVRGAITTGNPFAASQIGIDLTNAITIPGVTSTLANQLIIVAGIASDNLSTLVTVTGTDPAAYNEDHYSDITTGADAAGWFASAVRTAAGATGNIVNTFDAAMPAGGGLVAAMLDPVVTAVPRYGFVNLQDPGIL